MIFPLGNHDAIQRLNTSCRKSNLLLSLAESLLDAGDIDSAMETLTAARRAEPRTIESMEILRRIQHLEQVDPDYPEASIAQGVLS